MDLKKSKRKINYIVIHCTATPEFISFDANNINTWHKAKGWSEIGYNYVVKLNGFIEEGRDVDKIPAHVSGYNANSIGIVYVGGLDMNRKSKDTRTEPQKRSLTKLLKELRKLYPKAKILGHRDFPNVKKACPCFDAKTEYKSI